MFPEPNYMRTLIRDLGQKKGEEVTIKGWIDVRRDQGKLVFLDFRDFSGYVQGVILPGSGATEVGKEVRPEWVVEVSGKVNERPERNKQEGKQNGDIELEILGINVLNKAETPPLDVTGDGKEIGEDVRLKYRYLDLRRDKLHRNIMLRNRRRISVVGVRFTGSHMRYRWLHPACSVEEREIKKGAG